MRRTDDHTTNRVIEPQTRVTGRVRDLLRYRELLVNLVRKELRVKYKNSVLGFVWSMLNPALYLVIFWIVFTKFLPAQHPELPDLPRCPDCCAWNLWSGSLGGSVDVADRQREPRHEGVLPARDPRARHDRREPHELLLPVRRAARAR